MLLGMETNPLLFIYLTYVASRILVRYFFPLCLKFSFPPLSCFPCELSWNLRTENINRAFVQNKVHKITQVSWWF